MNLEQLELNIGYKFKNPQLLQEALTHPSVRQNRTKVKDYERMEFLGDSILGFLITDMLFKMFPDYSEGQLAKIKAYIVSHDILVEIANKLNLSDYIFMTYGEEKSGGRENNHNLENVVESLLAAIYLDSDIYIVQKIVHDLWQHYSKEDFDFDLLDPKSSLQAITQQLGLSTPQYEVIHRSGSSHSPHFTVKLCTSEHSTIGRGHAIKEAQKSAAKEMIIELKAQYPAAKVRS
jgi:ribonuclease III